MQARTRPHPWRPSMPNPASRVLPLVLFLAAGSQANAQDVRLFANGSQDQLDLGTYQVPGGKTLELAVGIGSSLYHRPGDPEDRFWALSDRGPNIACGDAQDILGVDPKQFCAGIKQGRIYPQPAFAPSIYE